MLTARRVLIFLNSRITWNTNFIKHKSKIARKKIVQQDVVKPNLSLISELYFNENEQQMHIQPKDTTLEDWTGSYEATDNKPPETFVRHGRKVSRLRRKINSVEKDDTEQLINVICKGCGSKFHSIDPNKPGYIPKDKTEDTTDETLSSLLCQRCYYMQRYNTALDIAMSQEEYKAVLSRIQQEKALVIVLVDLLDPSNSLCRELGNYLHPKQPVFIVGNKVDLIPKDGKGYLERIKDNLEKQAMQVGLKNIKGIQLTSAKTGYGIESMVTKLLKHWNRKGHIFLLGCTNAGKSSLFNALLNSDLCMSHVSDMIQRATISIWPGTTLGLLKFPILSATPHRLYQRVLRLKQEHSAMQEEHELRSLKLKESGGKIHHALLRGDVKSTFKQYIEKDFKPHDIATFSFDSDLCDIAEQKQYIKKKEEKQVFEDSDLPAPEKTRWFYDTPGLINSSQIMNHLSQDDLERMTPNTLIIPRTYIIKPGYSILLTGLSRIDYLQGEAAIYFTVLAANRLPVNVCKISEVDQFYMENFGQDKLAVPQGLDVYLNTIPSLVGKEVHLTGTGWETCAADVQLSSIGWVAITAGTGMAITLRCFTPDGAGCLIRDPPFLQYIVNVRGRRIRGTPAYHMKSAKFMM